jgi:fatty-acyl-CoA synthase
MIPSARSEDGSMGSPAAPDFEEPLPRTATGKLQKFVIREAYWRGLERRVG